MSFENGLIQIQDPTTTSRVLNITQTGSVNSANVVLRNSTGSIIDTLPVSGTLTVNQGTNPWTVSGTVTATISGTPTVDTELPAATLIADNETLPTTSRIGAVMQGKDAAGGTDIDVVRLAKAHDLDTGAGTEYGTGVTIRVEASGGSIAQTYGAGAVAAGTQRVTHASDDPVTTALQLIDNAVSGAGFNITQQGGVAVSLNTGVRDSGTQRVTIATNDIVPVSQSGTWTVQPGNIANTTPWLAQTPFSTRLDTYTVTGNGTTVDVSTKPVKYFSVQVKGTAVAASLWDVRLEVSLNNIDFTQAVAHTNTDGDGVVKTLAIASFGTFPALYFRSRCAGLTLGAATDIKVTILGTN